MDRHLTCVRLARPEDAAAIAAIYDPIVRDTPISFEETPPAAADMRRRIDDETKFYPWLVAEDGSVAGYAYACAHRSRAAYRWAIEVSVYVREDVRRSGVARALYTALFRVVEAQGFRKAIAVVEGRNLASIAFHRAFGFAPVGIFHRVGYTLGAWHDIECLEYDIGVGTDPPKEPVSIRSIDLHGVLKSD